MAFNKKNQPYFYITANTKIIDITADVKIAVVPQLSNYKAAENDCIANAILQHESKPQCEVEKLPSEFTIFKNLIRNRYLFYTTNEIPGHLLCGESRTRITMKSGLITNPPGCSVETALENINAPNDESLNYKDLMIYALPDNKIDFNYVNASSGDEVKKFKLPSDIPTAPATEDTPAEEDFHYIKTQHFQYHLIAFWIIFASLTSFGIGYGFLKRDFTIQAKPSQYKCSCYGNERT